MLITGLDKKFALTVMAGAISLALGNTSLHAEQKTIGAITNTTGNNFTMLDRFGTMVGGTNDVIASWDGTVFTNESDYSGPNPDGDGGTTLPGATTISNMTLTSDEVFSASLWVAHDIQVFAPGTYTFDTSLGGGNNESGFTTMIVGPDQLGVHMLFDWGGNDNIDVLVVWDQEDIFGSGNAFIADACQAGYGTPITNCIWDGIDNGLGNASGILDGSKPSGNTIWSLVSSDANGDGIPGIPMASGGPFTAFNASFSIMGPSNFAPITFNDVAGPVGPNNTLNNIDVLSNDVDIDGTIDTTTVAIASQPVGGTATANPDGTVSYTNTSGILGEDTFTYTVKDNENNVSSPAVVSVTIGAGGAPVCIDSGLTTPEDNPLIINVDGDLITPNCTDPDDDTLTLQEFTQPPLGTGVITDNFDGTLIYTPPENYFGDSSFTYTVNDGNGNTDTATVTVTVTPVNDNPVAADDLSATTVVDTPVVIDVLANDADADDDPLTISGLGSTTSLDTSAAITDSGKTVTYTPTNGFSDVDTFTYSIDDGNGGSDSATVQVTVQSSAFIGPIADDNPGAQISPDITGGSNFSMLDPDGLDVGGTNDLGVSWDGTIFTEADITAGTANRSSMIIFSEQPVPFFGFPWVAHDVRVFGPGTYTFDTGLDPSVNTNFGTTNLGGTPLVMTVGPDQLGAHVLFDWNVTSNIDVVMAWDINAPWAGPVDGSNPFASTGAMFNLSVSDFDNDGIPGIKMVDGPFKGFNANFNLNINPIFALPAVDIRAAQATNDPASIIVPAGGDVILTAIPGAGIVNPVYDWSGSDADLLAANTNGTTSSAFEFDPSGLADGPTNAQVIIKNSANDLQNIDQITLTVDSTVSIAEAVDSDGDGIADIDDPAANPLSLLGTKGSTNTYLLQSDKGTIILGDTAHSLGVFGAELVSEDFPSDSVVSNSCVGGCFDFEVVGLQPSASLKIVLPLSNAISANAVLRLFANGSWNNFRETGTAPGAAKGGMLFSAPGGPGTCPPPGDSAYIEGLNEGDFCIQMLVYDGGLNDADYSVNGRFKDPVGLAGSISEVATPKSSIKSPSIGGSCSLANGSIKSSRHAEWLLIAGFVVWLGWRSRRQRRH